MVSSRTSTAPEACAAIPPIGRAAVARRLGRARWRAVALAGVGATSSAIWAAVSADWRCGRTTRPMGWSVAAWRSTRTVRSLAATGAVVTTALRAATAGGSEAGSPKKSSASSHDGIGRGLGAEPGVVRVVGDQDRCPTRPTSRRGARRAPERRRRLAEDGQDVARPERDEPGALLVVADGKHDGTIGEGGLVVLEDIVADVPRVAVLDADEARRRRVPWRVGETERDAGRRDADRPHRGTGRAAPKGEAQQAVGGLEGTERRHAVEALEQGRRVHAPSDRCGRRERVRR